MKFGVFGLNTGSTFTASETIRLARLAEELGLDSVWAGEHIVVPSPRVPPSPMEPTDPLVDPLIHLALLAAVTDRILLATGIIILPQRNPLVLAKQAASLDVLSSGRLILSIGAGYLEPEMTACGVPFTERGARTDDYIKCMQVLWSHPGPVEYHGRFCEFSGVDAHPRPFQPGGPKLVVGGHTPPALRRAAKYANGWYGFALTPEAAAECVEALHRAASEVDRPEQLGHLEVSVTPRRRIDGAAVEAFTRAGVDRLVVNVVGLPSPEAVEERIRDVASIS